MRDTAPTDRTARRVKNTDRAAAPTGRKARRAKDAGPPATPDDEKATLRGFLDYLREAIITKASGVEEPAVREPGVSSGTNLLGLVKHLTYVERFYFLGRPITSMRRTFQPTRKETVEQLVADYREAVRESNEVIDACTDLTEPAPRPGRTMRWTLVHMIEETARHAGHADILREQIDGATGR
ncbi:DinB family protein [Actinoplanes sp. LDG1-06]|uniref:DinB family protein n=1 Tax=Paractinoplanes ovalisporus TaxID=2810368 RepID=A0ABS2AM51_9ACTN|nr:DinB family protein [Actinoplanes ovalisporus]MBM2620301.1 DinB family protein [Actinoplanes ovalisporus]